MKKALKIVGSIVAILIGFLIIAPFVFKPQLKDMIRKLANKNVNAKVAFADVHISLISSFPKAHVAIENLKITTNAPFENDTLISSKSIAVDMAIKELFKKSNDEPITINTITIEDAKIAIKINKNGKANYDIAKKSNATTKNDSNNNGFTLDIENYAIKNSAISYHDTSSNIALNVNQLNHSGKAIVSGTQTELNTHTDTFISFSMDSTNYLSNNSLKLDAILDLDLKNNKYTFKDNKLLINSLPLEFNGFLQLIDDGQLIDMSFENPGATFKDFLALIPKKYTKSIENVNTNGSFKLKGSAIGKLTDNTIPKLDINLISNNASFKYPDLPKAVENININATVKNATGHINDTYINLDKLNFKIDADVFNTSAQFKNITKNMIVDAKLDGTVNLDNITKAYPIELDKELSGIVKANLDTHFDIDALEKNDYQRIKNNGTLHANNLVFSSDDIVNPIHISNANINFKPGTVTLEDFNAKTGKSDINAKGTLTNLLAYLVTGKKLKGDFNVNSEQFLVSDFMVEGGSEQPVNQSVEPATALKIPSFLDCSVTANAKTVVYDNLTLKNVKGKVHLADEKAVFDNLSSSIFDGNLNFNGSVNTKEKTPTFKMKLDAEKFDITQSFKSLELLQALAPVANALQGKLNTSIKLDGTLGDDFTPILTSVSGDALAELFETKIKPEKQKLLSELQSSMQFLNFNKFNLKDLQTKITFKNGKATVHPFNISYNDITMAISGTHSFNNVMDYNLKVNVPAKYLGNEVNQLITKIGDNSIKNTKVPVTVNITGLYNSPKIKTDLKSSVTNLTNKLIQIQKQKLINKGKNKAEDVLNDVIKDKIGNDTPVKDVIDVVKGKSKDPVKDVIDIIGGKKNNNNSNNNSNPVDDILDIFGKKKKN